MKSKITVHKAPPRLCEVCQSTNVQFFISYTDRDNPVYSNYKGVRMAGCNESVMSCPDCVEPATAILLRKANLVK